MLFSMWFLFPLSRCLSSNRLVQETSRLERYVWFIIQILLLQARPLFKDRMRFAQMADPMLSGQYPSRGLYQALAVAAMCVQEQPNMRPVIADVVTALSYLASQRYDPGSNIPHSSPGSASTPPRINRDSDRKLNGGRRYDRNPTRRL